MSKKLLLADDSITIQKVIQIIFAHEEYELTITDNGDAALVKAQEIKPDLVLSDVYMPGLNGYELTSAIKQDPALQHVPVLLLAGSFEPFDEDKAKACKADAWIEKPFESQSLIDKVAELLDAASGAGAEPEAPAAVAEAVPAPAPETVAEEAPLSVFDDEVKEVSAAQDDSFGDISFDEESSETEPETVAVAEDWSDVAVEPEASAPVLEETAFVAEEPATEAAEDFGFAEEEPAIVETTAPVTEIPVADVDLDTFDMGHEEIMPLGDDDILGAEDLEPVMPEQTLAAWSRTDADEEDAFSESSQEFPAIEADEVFETPVAEEPVADEASEFTDPVAETIFEEAPVSPVEEMEPAAVAAAMVDVEEKASAMSEEDVEQIIEKVVTKVVEKLAGSILERVAWEVVPDLAESLIREEIRKIKDAAA